MTTYLHGGIAGLNPGDILTPSPPRMTDGCPVCVARSQGRVFTIGQFRRWIDGQKDHPNRATILAQLEGEPDDAPMDPPSSRKAVYITTDFDYALWYAARSQGDLYEVRPIAKPEPSPEDHFPSWTVDSAIVVKVIRRRVRLDRRDRRRITRRWQKADRMVLAGGSE